jgi:hypothetical protein
VTFRKRVPIRNSSSVLSVLNLFWFASEKISTKDTEKENLGLANHAE